MQPGPNDVPAPCAKCGGTQLHRPDGSGALHCLRCMAAEISTAVADGNDRDDPSAVHLSLYVKRALLTVVFMFIAIAAFAHACNAK